MPPLCHRDYGTVKRGKPVADLCINTTGSISPHTSSLEDVVGEKKKHIVCYVA